MVIRCAWCGRYHDPDGAWRKHRGRQPADTSHGVCPDCYGLLTAASPSERPERAAQTASDSGTLKTRK